MGEAREAITCALQQQPYPVLVGYLGAVDLGLEHQPFRIYQEVTLPTTNLLPAIVAPRLTTDARGLGRLGVNHPCTGLRIPPQPCPQALAQRSVEPLPGPVHPPPPEPAVDGLPGWEVPRKQSPGAAAPQDVEDG